MSLKSFFVTSIFMAISATACTAKQKGGNNLKEQPVEIQTLLLKNIV